MFVAIATPDYLTLTTKHKNTLPKKGIQHSTEQNFNQKLQFLSKNIMQITFCDNLFYIIRQQKLETLFLQNCLLIV